MGSYLLPNQKVRGPDWLMLGSLGSGTYLGNEDEETDELVACGIIAGIGHGWNVIDTASNYRNGRCAPLATYVVIQGVISAAGQACLQQCNSFRALYIWSSTENFK